MIDWVRTWVAIRAIEVVQRRSAKRGRKSRRDLVVEATIWRAVGAKPLARQLREAARGRIR